MISVSCCFVTVRRKAVEDMVEKLAVFHGLLQRLKAEREQLFVAIITEVITGAKFRNKIFIIAPSWQCGEAWWWSCCFIHIMLCWFFWLAGTWKLSRVEGDMDTSQIPGDRMTFRSCVNISNKYSWTFKNIKHICTWIKITICHSLTH